MSAAWAEYLEAEHRAVTARLARPDADFEPAGFSPPTGLGPLPPSLVPLATALVDDLAVLQERLREVRDQTARELRLTRQLAGGRTPPVSSYLDTRG